ncbi:MAG TPA: AMP-binding protein [Chloroflexota bacterium]|nr:AMP-binding protein [Chloroflexota bacterium]
MYTHLYEVVQERARALPDAIALGSQDGLRWQTISGARLLALVDRLAAELADEGVRAGDRVVLWLPSHWRTPVYLFALWKLGAVAVPFDREMNPEAGAKIFAAIAPRRLLVGFDEHPAWAPGCELTPWWEPGSRVAVAPPTPWAPPAEELAVVVYTSGTTGTPKGCMITHGNLCSQVEALRSTVPLDASCRLASVLPLSHLFELTVGLLYPLAQGAAIHYVPSRRGPEIARVFAEQRITHMLAVPQLLAVMGQAADERLRAALPAPVYRGLLALAPRLPLAARRWLFWPIHRRLGGHVRVFVSGGAALPPETQQLWERFGVQVIQGYGTSECSPVIAGGAADGSTPAGSVGKALPGVEVRLSAEGELLVRGPNVMRGYWQDPARTAEVLHDGWYATGDLAKIDARGNIWLQGRARDLIKLPSGMAVWPQDVEDVLRTHPAVKDAAVVAVPGPGGGATLHAYLLPALPPGQVNLAELIATCNGRLAQHQRLATASWWPEPDFPRTAMLKVRRHLLPPPDTAHAVQIESALAADDPVGQAIAGVAHAGAVRPDQTLAALGLDSLGLVELAQALEEKTGKVVADGDLKLEMTSEQVRALVAAAPPLAAEREPEPRGLAAFNAAPPRWPYTWGRVFRGLALPFDLLYRVTVPRTIILGAEHLADLPPRVIFAGTHHSFADMPLVRYALARSAARRLGPRLIVVIGGEGFIKAGLASAYGILAFGLYPLLQRSDREASLRRLVSVAATGAPLLIFPQGTHADPARERAADPAVEFRLGTAHLAAALDASVVPFGLAGTESVMLPGAPPGFRGLVVSGIPVWLRRRPLAIAFGPPLTLAPGESPQAFTARLQAACYSLTREAERALDPGRWRPPAPRSHVRDQVPRTPVAPRG